MNRIVYIATLLVMPIFCFCCASDKKEFHPDTLIAADVWPLIDSYSAYNPNVPKTCSSLLAVNSLSLRETLWDAAWHPSGDMIATASDDANLTLWDIKNHPTVTKGYRLLGHRGSINSVNYSTDGSLLLSAGLDGYKIWDTKKMQKKKLPFQNYPNTAVRKALFTKAGTRIAASAITCYNLIDSQTHQRIARCDEQSFIYDILWLHDDTTLASLTANGLRLWDTRAYRPMRIKSFSNVTTKSYIPHQIACSDDDQIFITKQAATLSIIDRRTNATLYSIEDKTISQEIADSEERYIKSVQLHPYDDRIILISRDDGSLESYDRITGLRMESLEDDKPKRAALFSPDGVSILAVNKTDTVQLWRQQSLRTSLLPSK